ncbi:MAG: Bacterial extracellular solute-binding protein, family 5 Middle [Candidatus Bathyarchaeota archaeon BA1]|nr:MAG: Bacterial extracellular solute-binding protein, family 5 Middle [Candidatus Bathyarchaeota archaeon BA1]
MEVVWKMRKVNLAMLSALVFTLLLPMLMVPVPVAASPEVKWSPYGPRIDEMVYKMIPDYAVGLSAFELGEIDIVGVYPAHLDRIKESKPIKEWGGEIIRTVGINTLGLIQFNVRDRIGPPFETSPYNVVCDPAIRKAFAHIIDRDAIIHGPLLKGHAIKTTTDVMDIYGDWQNPIRKKIDYETLYPLSFERANAILDAAGYKMGPDGYRTYVVPEKDELGRPYPDAGKTKRLEVEVIALPEAISPVYYSILMQYVEHAKKIGIMVKPDLVTAAILSARVFGTRVFQTYLVGWSMGMYPAFMYTFWHSKEDRWVDATPKGWNWAGVHNATLDGYIDKSQFTTDVAEAKYYQWKMQEITADIVPWVPVYSAVSYTAISGKWKGWVLSYGKYEEPRMPLAMHPLLTDMGWYSVDPATGEEKKLGGTFNGVIGIIPATLNPMNYMWAAEYVVLSRMFNSLTETNPDNIYDTPARIRTLIEDYKFEDILYEGVNSTKVTLYFKKGVKWHDGVPLTAYDLDWTWRYPGHAWKTIRYYVYYVPDIVKTEIPDPYTIIAYIKSRSWLWLEYLLFATPLPMHIFGKVPNPFGDPSRISHPERPDLTQLIGTGRFICVEHVVGKLVRLTWNPEYHFRHPEKGLRLSVTTTPSIKEPIEEDVKISVEVKVTDYLDKAVTDAEVSVSASGPISALFKAEHIGAGTYKATLAGLLPGKYDIGVKAERAIPYGALRGTYAATLSIYPLGLPPPPPPPVGVVALPPAPTLPPAITLPTPVVGIEAVMPQVSLIITAIVVVTLGVLVVKKRRP